MIWTSVISKNVLTLSVPLPSWWPDTCQYDGHIHVRFDRRREIRNVRVVRRYMLPPVCKCGVLGRSGELVTLVPEAKTNPELAFGGLQSCFTRLNLAAETVIAAYAYIVIDLGQGTQRQGLRNVHSLCKIPLLVT